MSDVLFNEVAQRSTVDGVRRTAHLSRCHTYRWYLSRAWGGDLFRTRRQLWVMLNPSTADGLEDDPTIRRCIDFAKRDGFDSIAVVNLFAYRATDPKALDLGSPNRVGYLNDIVISEAIRMADQVVVGWGAHGDRFPSRVVKVMELLNAEPVCLGTTKSGQPRHPLYMPKSTEMVPWRPM